MKTQLPDYRVRHSPKARNLRLKVTRADGLCVVVPSGFDEKKIPGILKRKKVWIAEAMTRIGETKRFLEPAPVAHLPECLRLAALGETWSICYRVDASRPGLWLRAEAGTLIFSGATMNREAVIRKITDWLRLRIKEGLFPLADRLAKKHHLKLGGLLVKSQRTRWASCSAKRNLTLNTKLLFLPPHLVRYVLIHELCHTVYTNHNSDFWRLVQALEPGYKGLDQELRTAWKRVPAWMF